MTTDYQPFWVVWNPAGRTPTFKHYDQAEAVREAERLATANPGQKFIVLESKTLICKTDLMRIDLRPDAETPY